MTFKEAFALMKQGKKVKLPLWHGYWYWDEDKKTVMIQCDQPDKHTGKTLLDIRETNYVDSTLTNITSDEWMIADKTNCRLLGGDTFDFNTALGYMKRGIKVTRKNHGEIYLNDKVIVNRFEDLNLPICFNLEDIEATDWVIYVG